MIDGYATGVALCKPPLILPPLPPTPTTKRAKVTKLGYDQLEISFDGNRFTLTRSECFALIGQLERIGGTL